MDGDASAESTAGNRAQPCAWARGACAELRRAPRLAVHAGAQASLSR